MAKSKQQKQLEAIERKRQHLSYQRQVYLEAQWGSQTYNKKLQVIPQEKLDQHAAEAKRIFLKACAEAQVDAHGNPLPGSPGYNEPGLLMDKAAVVKAKNVIAVDPHPTDPKFSIYQDPAVIEQMKLSVKHLDISEIHKLEEPVVLKDLTPAGIEEKINSLRDAAKWLRENTLFNDHHVRKMEQAADRLEKMLKPNLDFNGDDPIDTSSMDWSGKIFDKYEIKE